MKNYIFLATTAVLTIPLVATVACGKSNSKLKNTSEKSKEQKDFEAAIAANNNEIPDDYFNINGAYDRKTFTASVQSLHLLPKDLTIPNTVTKIGANAFNGVEFLKPLIIPSSVISIGYSAFEEATFNSDLTIGNSITSIAESAFQESQFLGDVNFAANISETSKELFNGAKFYKHLNITSPNITSIGEESFKGAKLPIEFAIPSTVILLSDYAFTSSKIGTSFVIPSSVETIGKGSLSNISSYIYTHQKFAKWQEDGVDVKDEDLAYDLSHIPNSVEFELGLPKDIFYGGHKYEFMKK